MKKIISTVLCLILILNVMCSCSKDSKGSDNNNNASLRSIECSNYEEFEKSLKENGKIDTTEKCELALKIAKFFSGRTFGHYYESGYLYALGWGSYNVIFSTDKYGYLPICFHLKFPQKPYLFDYENYEQIGVSTYYKRIPDPEIRCNPEEYLFYLDELNYIIISPDYNHVNIHKFDENYEYYYDPEGKLLENFVALCEELKAFIEQ